MRLFGILFFSNFAKSKGNIYNTNHKFDFCFGEKECRETFLLLFIILSSIGFVLAFAMQLCQNRRLLITVIEFYIGKTSLPGIIERFLTIINVFHESVR